MPHSKFKGTFFKDGNGSILKCSCGHTFTTESERDRKMKMRLHDKVCTIKAERSEFRAAELPKEKVNFKEYENMNANMRRSFYSGT